MSLLDTLYDVTVVGLGPVGATLANILGKAGLRVLVLEREGRLYHLPRAVQFDDEVMRVFQGIGLAGRIEPDTHVNPGMRFVDAGGELLLDWPRPMMPTAQGWHASYRFHQPDLESVLRDGLARFGSVDCRTRHALLDVSPPDADGHCTLQVTDLDAGRDIPVRTRWVVGCDGAHSTIRQLIGSDWDDLGFHERWLVIDVLLKAPMPSLGDHSIQYCDALQACTYVRGTGRRRRWEMALPADIGDSDAMAPDAVWRRLARWLDPADADIERSAVYTFRSVIAQRWHRDRLLIAGDAAHLTPPFMGQGMCAGIRDVANLGWKLVAVLEGRADTTLLDSYASERRAHVHHYIETAVALGRLINTVDSEAALRRGLPQQDGSRRLTTITPPLGPGLGRGEHAMIGRLAPQLQDANGGLLDTWLGERHVLIARDAVLASVAATGDLAELDVRVVPSTALTSAATLLDTLEVEALLLRPDHYVLAVAETVDGVGALLDTLKHYWHPRNPDPSATHH